MPNAKKKPVPEFSSEDEERTFWAERPDPKPARATVQVAGLIGGAKIEISAIAVKQ